MTFCLYDLGALLAALSELNRAPDQLVTSLRNFGINYNMIILVTMFTFFKTDLVVYLPI